MFHHTLDEAPKIIGAEVDPNAGILVNPHFRGRRAPARRAPCIDNHPSGLSYKISPFGSRSFAHGVKPSPGWRFALQYNKLYF
jgi:hypothetical protein